MKDLTRAHLLVSGKVQGVFYRAKTKETARRLGINGWVRNLPDGQVEAVFEGPKEAIAALIDWCHEGPAAAEVTQVAVEYGEPEGLQGFEVR
jgi:acylphosphatase